MRDTFNPANLVETRTVSRGSFYLVYCADDSSPEGNSVFYSTLVFASSVQEAKQIVMQSEKNFFHKRYPEGVWNDVDWLNDHTAESKELVFAEGLKFAEIVVDKISCW